MNCGGCFHIEDGKCTEKSCVYVHINENDLHNNGYHIKNDIWNYNNKYYKIVGFEIGTNEFICVKARL